MDKGHKETITIRIVSCAFMVLALAIFKPFGLEVWQWQAYIHLLSIFALGLLRRVAPTNPSPSTLLTYYILKPLATMSR